MIIDPVLHKRPVVVDDTMSTGLAVKVPGAISASLARLVEGMIGHDVKTEDGTFYPGQCWRCYRFWWHRRTTTPS